MVVNSPSRWNMIREINRSRRSGTLVVQLGQKYISWTIQAGRLGWISSNHRDYSMTEFLLQNQHIPAQVLHKARSGVTESRSLGAVLVREGVADPDTVRRWTSEHAAMLCPFLLQSGVHVFWADRTLPPKPDFILHQGVPLSRILLGCERTSVEIRAAFHFQEEMPLTYRIDEMETVDALLSVSERRLVPYLKRGDPLHAILADPELDRLTCCRALFLLWIAGLLRPVSKPVLPEAAAAAPVNSWMDRIRSVPPDWVIPLVVGILLGTLFSPSAEPPAPAEPPVHRLSPMFQGPAWRDMEAPARSQPPDDNNR